jgi:hypothetical protein
MASTVFNLGGVKILKNILRFQNSNVQIITGNSADPTVTAVDAVVGSIYIRANGEIYIKNSSGNNTDFRQVTSQAALDNHINDVSDAHAASAITNTPSGNLAATNVQAALDELQSDVDSRALDSAVIKKDGSVTYTAAQSMGGFKLTSLANGTAASDAVNKGQMDAALEGLKPKAAVRVATTANITIATALNSGDVIDGITLANGDRVLVKDQTAAEANGIYVVSATPARSTDFDSLSPIDEINGSLVAVQEGTANAGKVFVQSGTVAVLDTDPINFVFFNSSSTLVGGDGITVSGSNISVDHDGEGLQFVSTQLSLELDGTSLSKSASGLKVNSITSTEVSDFNEAAQDAVGSILQTGTKINFTYNDALNTISAGIVTQSLSNTDIALSAGIALTKLETVASPNRVLVSDASSFIQASAVTTSELNFISGLTSNVQTQLNDKASTTLNNLGTTSINANLLPDAAGTRNLGSVSLPWQQLTSNNLVATNISLFNTIGGTSRGIIDATTPRTLASGDVSEFTIWAPNLSSTDIGIQAGDPASGVTGSVFVSTGNASVNNNSGSIRLYTGTVSGTGVRGTIDFRDASLAGASVGYIWTLSNVTTGAGNWAAAPAGYTDEQAQDAIGTILTDTATIDLTYNDATPSITADVIDGSISNVKIASGVDAVKIADGSVSNTEFQYLDGVTSSIQTQLNGKQAAGITTRVNATNASMTSTVTDEVITGLTFAHASFNGCYVEYRIKKGTLVRTGRFLVSTDGTEVAFNDSFVETVDSTVVFDAVVNGANINIRHSNAESGTMVISFEQNLFPV